MRTNNKQSQERDAQHNDVPHLASALSQVTHEKNGTHAKNPGSNTIKNRRPDENFRLLGCSDPEPARRENHARKHHQPLATDPANACKDTREFCDRNHHHLEHGRWAMLPGE